MALKIRLSRHGKRNQPFYRVVVADSEKPRDGRFIEVVGWYDPRKAGKQSEIKMERVKYWTGKGATPSDTVASLLI